MILWDHRDVLKGGLLFWGPGVEFWTSCSRGGVFFLVVFSEHFSEYCWKTIQDSQRPKTDRREKVSSSTQKSVDTASQWGRLSSIQEAMCILYLTHSSLLFSFTLIRFSWFRFKGVHHLHKSIEAELTKLERNRSEQEVPYKVNILGSDKVLLCIGIS